MYKFSLITSLCFRGSNLTSFVICLLTLPQLDYEHTFLIFLLGVFLVFIVVFIIFLLALL